MTRAVAFDTHAFVKKLRGVGFTEEQAEVQVEALASPIDERLATRDDCREARRTGAGTRLDQRRRRRTWS